MQLCSLFTQILKFTVAVAALLLLPLVSLCQFMRQLGDLAAQQVYVDTVLMARSFD